MKKKVFHIVPDNRLGGIFIYIERLSINTSKNHKHFIFNGQPKLESVYRKGIKPLNLREHFSSLIFLDLIINLPIYIFYIISHQKIIFHTPFLLFHHLLACILGKESYLILHDYNIIKPLQKIFLKLKPKNVFCASHVLIDNFKFHNFAKVLPPFYSDSELSYLYNNKIIDYEKKSNIIFLGNINKVKQISNFCNLFSNYINKNDPTLFIYGNIIHKQSYREIIELSSDKININPPVAHDKVDNLLRGFKFLLIPSESEVFPIVYFEALSANLIPIVNDIPFFRFVSGKSINHIFKIEEPETIKSTLDWAKNLKFDEYNKYLEELKYSFINYYRNNSSNLKKVFGY